MLNNDIFLSYHFKLNYKNIIQNPKLTAKVSQFTYFINVYHC